LVKKEQIQRKDVSRALCDRDARLRGYQNESSRTVGAHLVANQEFGMIGQCKLQIEFPEIGRFRQGNQFVVQPDTVHGFLTFLSALPDTITLLPVQDTKALAALGRWP
jgi:hypothetical protein